MHIDAHQHFWQYTDEDYGWIGENEQIIKRDFLPEHLLPVLQQNQIDGCVAVQARQTLEETQWLLALAKKHHFIKGVVGWVDIRSEHLIDQLNQFSNESKLKGFRHVLQDEADPDFMLQDAFIRGLQLIAQHEYVYDLLIFSHQLPQAIKLIKTLPQLPMVIDHIAKPNIATGEGFALWEANIQTIAQHKHVYCKVSGMVTEADVNAWEKGDFTRYLDVIFAAFGTERIMYGSDWPVCLLGGDYKEIKTIVEDYLTQYCPNAKKQVFGLTAEKFYSL